MKRVLITGGSGFVGRHLTRALLDKFPDVEITTLSRSEAAISSLLIMCSSPRLRIRLGDVREADAIKCMLKGIDTVIHLAAMKRVDLSETECRQAVTTNVIGTLNIMEYFEGNTFILMSSDKAVEPVNCYGATKLVAERLLMEQANKVSKSSRDRYMVVRSGNILNSTGSVMDIWRYQIMTSNEITVTHPDMVRFYIGIETVVKLFLAVLEQGENGKIYFTPCDRALVLRTLVDEVLKRYGNESTKIRYIGLRPGERMEERMNSPCETNTICDFEKRFNIPLDKIPGVPQTLAAP